MLRDRFGGIPPCVCVIDHITRHLLNQKNIYNMLFSMRIERGKANRMLQCILYVAECLYSGYRDMRTPL